MSKRLEKYTTTYVCEVIYRYSGLVEPILNAVCYDGGWVGNAEKAFRQACFLLHPLLSGPHEVSDFTLEHPSTMICLTTAQKHRGHEPHHLKL